MATASNLLITEEQINEEQIPKWRLAHQGIQLLINNKAEEAQALFKRYPNDLQMYAGYSFAVFMDALMTFEEDKLNVATATLKEIERRCAICDSGWLKSMKSKVFGSDSNSSSADYLECQIILADSQVCLAILTFLQQDLSGYLKGGWVLRKSWKVYQSAYTEIQNLYKEIVGELPDTIAHHHAQQRTDDEEPGATSDSSFEWDFPEETETLSSTPPSNGYIQNKNPYLPKMSRSYTTNFDSKQNFCNHSSNFKCNCVSNNNLTGDNDNVINNTNCNFAIANNCSNVINNDSDRSTATTPDLDVSCSSSKTSNSNSLESGKSNGSKSRRQIGVSKVNLFLKKSTSVNGALSKHLEKNKRPNGFLSQISPFSSNLSLSYITSTFNIFSSEKQKTHDIDKDTIERLMSAVSFGFGLFHLGISLLPPSLLKITNFFGFGGNRHIGISNLLYARQGTDMRAPLATLSLLWYHTIVRPFYALDGSNVQAGVRAATQLLDESREAYGDSALFLFFNGRVHRLNSDIPGALQAFQASVDNSNQREIKILSLHEVGWCHLIQLDYPSAEHTFQILKLSSRWSRSFYAYLATICSGSCNNLRDFSNLRETINLFEGGPKGSQLELFLSRRFKCCPKSEEEMETVNCNYWKMFVYELLYLWNTLPSCNNNNITTIIDDCQSIINGNTSEPMLGISQLIKGICHYIIKQYEDAIKSFRKCLELRTSKAYTADDSHISAFAQYELGSILIKNIDTKEEGKVLLNNVSQYKDYDFEQRLNVRIHTILKHI